MVGGWYGMVVDVSGTTIPTFMLLSGFARIQNGMVDVLSGAPEMWFVEDVGDRITPGILVVMELDRAEFGAGAVVEVVCTSPSGLTAGRLVLDPGPVSPPPGDAPPADSPAVISMVGSLDMVVSEVGTHVLTATHRASGATNQCRFWTRVTPPKN